MTMKNVLKPMVQFGDPPFREAPKYSWVDNGRYSGLVDVPLFLVDVNGRIS